MIYQKAAESLAVLLCLPNNFLFWFSFRYPLRIFGVILHPTTGFGMCKVVYSTHPNFKKGDLVCGKTGWEKCNLIKSTEKLFKFLHADVPLSYNTGILGMPGNPAYCGFCEVCSPKKGDTVFISAASGAVSQLVEQFAKKLFGCHVVGSARNLQHI